MNDNDTLKKVNVDDPVVTVLGLGHIGLPTALGFAEWGRKVIGADSDPGKVALIRGGNATFYEPGLDELLAKHLKSGRFEPLEDVEEAIRRGSIIFICVGTPQRESGQADLSQVEAVARLVARNLNGYKLIVSKSTVPAITAQWLKKTIMRYRGGGSSALPLDLDVASNPEFLREGKALEDFFHPDRVVFGVESERARELLTDLYRALPCPLVVTDTSTSELIKHAANAYLSTKISFINMVSDLCEKVGADVTAVARGLGLDARIGRQFLDAGIGFGGYCFPKDLRAFIYLAEEHGVDFSLLREVERVNQQRIEIFVKKVRQALWVLRGKTIGVLGLAFKAGTDDIREAVSLKVVKALLDEGSILQMYDPQAMPNTQRVFPEKAGQLAYCTSAYEAARGAHALLLLTEWPEFLELDLARLKSLMEVPALVDGRNLFDPGTVRQAGFEYFSMGREGAGAAAPPSVPESRRA
jgi:UDPglucose 6-dehydrogenase